MRGCGPGLDGDGNRIRRKWKWDQKERNDMTRCYSIRIASGVFASGHGGTIPWERDAMVSAHLNSLGETGWVPLCITRYC